MTPDRIEALKNYVVVLVIATSLAGVGIAGIAIERLRADVTARHPKASRRWVDAQTMARAALLWAAVTMTGVIAWPALALVLVAPF